MPALGVTGIPNQEPRREPVVLAGVALEVSCPVCTGTGDDGVGPKSLLGKVVNTLLPTKWCDKCKGRGVVLTEEGRKFLVFVTSHIDCTGGRIYIRGQS